MTSGFSVDRLEYLQNLIILLENVSPDDPFTNEDYKSNYSILNDLGNEMNNKEVSRCKRKKKVDQVSVQADFETDEFYIPWLLGAERKIEDFCAQLCNLLNTLHQSRKIVLKTKRKASHSLATQDITNTHSRKSHQLSSISTSGYIKHQVDRSKTFNDIRVFELIENSISSILEDAIQLKNSIPKLGLEKADNIEEQIYERLEYKKVKERSVSKLERSKSSMHETKVLPIQSYKIRRGITMPIINESKSQGKKVYEKSKPLIKITSTSDKIANYSVPKTKNIQNSRNTAPEASSHSNKPKERNLQLQVLEVPTKDTGAIPKTRNAQRVTSSSTSTRTKKTKETNVKPIWK